MIALDKQAHFWAGAAISSSVALHLSDPILGLAVAVGAGAAKEIIDKLGFGTPDAMDFAATAIGGAVAVAPAFIA